MGQSTRSAIVKNVALVGGIEGISNHYDNGDDPNFNLNGWLISMDSGIAAGRKQSLYVDLAIKGELKVFILNTSQYACVGEFDFAVFSDDRSAVEEFLKDFSITDVTIEDIDSVCQTL